MHNIKSKSFRIRVDSEKTPKLPLRKQQTDPQNPWSLSLDGTLSLVAHDTAKAHVRGRQ